MKSNQSRQEHPCDLLGIPRDSSLETAKKARQDLNKRAHPDTGLPNASDLELISRVNAVYRKWEISKRAGNTFEFEEIAIDE